MNEEEVMEKFKRIKTWKKNGVRAPHKPLLILYALGQIQSKDKNVFKFADINEDLKELLKEFGPSRKNYRADNPFCYLRSDHLWTLNHPVPKDSPGESYLLKHDVSGGFPHGVIDLLRKNKGFIQSLAELILDQHFPETLHDDILDAVNLSFDYVRKRQKNRSFESDILSAYNQCCAVCGRTIQWNKKTIGIEAAHIKWKQADGPSLITNGIAFCSLHRKLFDKGLFTLTKESRIDVSPQIEVTKGYMEWLGNYHEENLLQPANPNLRPSPDFLVWHQEQVFKSIKKPE